MAHRKHPRRILVRLVTLRFLIVSFFFNFAPPALTILPGVRSPGPTFLYLALGDSTGLGLGAANKHGYVDQLMLRIQTDRPGWALLNLSSIGETTSTLLSRLDDGFKVRPSVITLSIGVNDALQRTNDSSFAENYAKIIERLLLLHCPIVITNLPDASLAPSVPKSMRESLYSRLVIFNAHIKTVAKKYHLLLVDLFGASRRIGLPERFFSSDGFHPSDAGYRFWASIMWPVLKRAIRGEHGRKIKDASKLMFHSVFFYRLSPPAPVLNRSNST